MGSLAQISKEIDLAENQINQKSYIRS